MLGAKPPKNSYVNYKVFQEQIKGKRAAKEEEQRTETQKEEISSQYFVKWTEWTDRAGRTLLLPPTAAWPR
ncbi:hypothetical protein MC885_008494 [Smutsia gigantea]|nr:hypothetical protein MC885_008494 [Smutsia gigantea]